MNFQPDENELSPAHKLFNRLVCTNVPSFNPQPKPSATKIPNEPETQNRPPTLKSGDTVRVESEKEKTWDKKGSVIARNDRPRLYNVLKELGNIIIRNRHHLIPTNEKLFIKCDYENIIEPRETTSRKTVVPARTDMPSNIAAQSVRTKSGRIIRKPKSYLEKY